MMKTLHILKPFSKSTNPFSKTIQTSTKVITLQLPNSAKLFQSSPSSSFSIFHLTDSTGSPNQIHTYLLKSGLVQVPSFRNQLIALYLKCHLPASARDLFDEIPNPNLVSFSALISSYTHNSLGRDALETFVKMRSLGVSSDVFTLPTLLKACTASSDLLAGLQIHAVAVVTGFESDVFVVNTLVVFYAKFGRLQDSLKLFGGILDKSSVSWNALFNGYVKNDQCEEAVDLFAVMVSSGARPNEFGFSTSINACTGSQDLRRGKVIHGFSTRLGFESDTFIASALVDMYAKLGAIEDATVVFQQMAQPDIVSWNTFISGCVVNGHDHKAISLLEEMRFSGVIPNGFTLSSILKACAGTMMLNLGQQIHANLIKNGLVSYMSVSAALVDLYAKCHHLQEARKAFDLIPEKDLVSWNTLISGFSHSGSDEEALFLFSKMRNGRFIFNRTTLSAVLKSIARLQALSASKQVHCLVLKSGLTLDPHVVDGLIDAYGKCSCIEEASRAFEECPFGDIVSFTSLITAQSQSGQGEEAIKLYRLMLKQKLHPDSFVLSSLLNACASLLAYEQGKQVHVHIVKLGFMSDVFAGNALVNMYAKCGSIEDANLAFGEIPERRVVSWSAIIGGLAQHGHGREALKFFDEMLLNGVTPNHITITSVLCACNHAGLVTEAQQYFASMQEMFGIEPTEEHYACIIDLLGRAGKLNSAMEIVSNMPFKANAAIWGALLGASRVHGDVELGKKAAEMLFLLEPEKSGTHILLANTYASAGLWDRVAEVRRTMKDSRVKKEPGMSWLEVKDKVHIW